MPISRKDAEYRRQANRAMAVSAAGLAATGVIELLLAVLTASIPASSPPPSPPPDPCPA